MSPLCVGVAAQNIASVQKATGTRRDMLMIQNLIAVISVANVGRGFRVIRDILDNNYFDDSAYSSEDKFVWAHLLYIKTAKQQEEATESQMYDGVDKEKKNHQHLK